jgi:protein TonB
MDWQDDEFETFLRQFQPRKPKGLPRRRRTVIALALAPVAAVVAVVAVVVAGVIPMRLGSKSSAAPDEAQAPTATPSPTTSVGNATDGVKSTPTVATASGPASRNKSVSATAGVASRRLKVGGPVKPPTKVVDVKPEYPDAARAAGISGVVLLEIVIGEGGSVIETGVIRSIPELDQAAIDPVSQWEFEPTVLNGERVEVEMVVTINFSLQ